MQKVSLAERRAITGCAPQQTANRFKGGMMHMARDLQKIFAGLVEDMASAEEGDTFL